MTAPRVLLFDVENTPNLAHIWSLWQETRSYDMVDRDWIVLCWAAMWDDSDRGVSRGLPHYGTYKSDPWDDRSLVQELWHYIDDSDILVAHNLVKFDLRKIYARFAYHNLGPPSPCRHIDTLKIARKHFAFTSNRLDDLGRHLGLGRKIKHAGFDLWRGAMAGDRQSWTDMIHYCQQDVKLLREVYHRLLPYASGTPNAAAYAGDNQPRCSKCGSTNLRRNGHAYTAVSKFQRYRCLCCGAYSRGRVNAGGRPATTGITS
jgi:hypothetical protein